MVEFQASYSREMHTGRGDHNREGWRQREFSQPMYLRAHRMSARSTDASNRALRHRFSAPGVPRGSLVRPRLDRLMAELFDTYSVVEMVAATGSGKTVQAQLYASVSERPLAWLTMDHRDRSASGLVFDIATALGPVAGDAVSVMRRALQTEGTPDEAAAILASSAGEQDCLFVIDECQQIARSEAAAAALDTFLEYLPERMRVLLLAREELPWPIQKRYIHGQIAQINDATLSLTHTETTEYVSQLSGSPEFSNRIFASTGGWVAGVALAARFGVENEPNFRDLSVYFDKQVLEPLPADERDFLLDTSVTDAITEDIALALCGQDGRRLLAAVSARHLPATSTTSTAIVCHSLFRSFLKAKLVETKPERHAELMRTYAHHLAATRQYEDATEAYLSLGDLSAGVETATRALPALFVRADWALVQRWIDAFGADQVQASPVLIGAQIRAIHGLREFEQASFLIRRLDREGRLRAAVEADPSLLATAAWGLQSNSQEVIALLDKYDGDHRADVVRYMIETTIGTRPAVPPLVQDFADVERLMSWGLFLQGRLGDLARMESTEGDNPVLNPNVVLASSFRGNVDDARRLWLRVPAEIRERPHSRFIEAMLDLAGGNNELGFENLRKAHSESQRSRFSLGIVYEVFLGYVLLADDKPDAAIDHLLPILESMSRTSQTAYAEWAQCFLGLAYLRVGRAAEARLMLREVVTSMTRSQRRLLLSMAAVGLSEAEASHGDDVAAREAAELAHHAALLTGSSWVLSQVIRMFPEVQRREAARSPEDSRWRRLAASPSVQSTAEVQPPSRPGATLRIQPFGRERDLYVDGVAAHIGRTKILELVAAVALHPCGINRFQLQQRLFPEADQRNGGNHFRQIAHKFRHGTGVTLERRNNLVLFPSSLTLIADDIESERLLAAASASKGEERIERLQAALSLVTGPYLEGSTLPWVEERRNYLDVIYEEGRLELATLYLELDRPEAARAECEAVIDANRYSDPAYRVLVEIERRVGSESSVLAAYRRATEALGELGLRPGDARRLMQRAPTFNAVSNSTSVHR
jgi:ATP/maltotriose-dependent transcriptional regulator MalT/DNA-binding SARP family transcriptional activator